MSKDITLTWATTGDYYRDGETETTLTDEQFQQLHGLLDTLMRVNQMEKLYERDSNKYSGKVDGPCPKCGEEMLILWYYRNPENGNHQHTKYVCTSWPHPGDRCDWEGWSVPGWDK